MNFEKINNKRGDEQALWENSNLLFIQRIFG